MVEFDLLISSDGTVSFVYDDRLAEVFDGETLHTTRASHVEPGPLGGWVADMSPVNGPFIGAHGTGATAYEVAPFKTRDAALQSERIWLRENKGL